MCRSAKDWSIHLSKRTAHGVCLLLFWTQTSSTLFDRKSCAHVAEAGTFRSPDSIGGRTATVSHEDRRGAICDISLGCLLTIARQIPAALFVTDVLFVCCVCLTSVSLWRMGSFESVRCRHSFDEKEKNGPARLRGRVILTSLVQVRIVWKAPSI